MTVYVDPIVTIEPKGEAARHGNRWCHMYADTLEELHEMAAKIGMRREWFQDKPSLAHYDLTPPKRAQAIKAGAQSVDALHVANFMKSRRSPKQEAVEASNAPPTEAHVLKIERLRVGKSKISGNYVIAAEIDGHPQILGELYGELGARVVAQAFKALGYDPAKWKEDENK